MDLKGLNQGHCSLGSQRLLGSGDWSKMSRRLVLMKAGLWAQSDHVTRREGKERDLGTGEGVVWLCLWALRPFVGKEVFRGRVPSSFLHVCV